MLSYFWVDLEPNWRLFKACCPVPHSGSIDAFIPIDSSSLHDIKCSYLYPKHTKHHYSWLCRATTDTAIVIDGLVHMLTGGICLISLNISSWSFLLLPHAPKLEFPFSFEPEHATDNKDLAEKKTLLQLSTILIISTQRRNVWHVCKNDSK